MPTTTRHHPTRPSSRQRARTSRAESRARIIAAATELVRERSYAELSVGEVMEEAGIGRTLFYRHFDDIGDLLTQASREAIEELLQVQLELEGTRDGAGVEAAVRAAIEPAVAVYRRHGPVLRALSEAAAGDEQIAAGWRAMRSRFDELVARTLRELSDSPPADVDQTAKALNLMNGNYLMDTFGRTPQVEPEVAVRTLSEIWIATITGGRR
jgi:AcrR family transcriptional regulator